MHKDDFIRAYFDDLEDKASFVMNLYDRGRRDEALILCCAYIAGLGTHLYWPATQDRLNFSRCLVEYGGQTLLCLVHPRALLDAVRGRGHVSLASVLESSLPLEPPELLEHERLLQLVTKHGPACLGNLDATWILGTVASVAYTRLRNPTAHRGRAPDFISFDRTTLNGEPVPDVGFPILSAGLKCALDSSRKLSLSTGKWFGHDYGNAS